jgi:hypothetical protein
MEPCHRGYDRRIAGVVSGGGGLRPALRLGHGVGSNRAPIALSGRVACLVDAGYGPVEPGDLLTSSPTSGHAMVASDPSRSFGAVLGKAIGRLDRGCDLVPVLVALQ